MIDEARMLVVAVRDTHVSSAVYVYGKLLTIVLGALPCSRRSGFTLLSC
jgi:hypothetical protein